MSSVKDVALPGPGQDNEVSEIEEDPNAVVTEGLKCHIHMSHPQPSELPNGSLLYLYATSFKANAKQFRLI